MGQKLELKVNKRTVLGKKVSVLRRQGITPVNLYGSGIESQALQGSAAELRRIVGNAGRTHLINLKIDEKDGPNNVMVRAVQINPLTGQLVHVDLYQVKMGEEVTVDVPIVLVGEAPAAKAKGSTVMQELETLTISSLPGEMPESIEVDITPLTGPEQALRVKDIKPAKGITIQNDPDTVIARVATAAAEQEEETPKPKSEPAPGELKQ